MPKKYKQFITNARNQSSAFKKLRIKLKKQKLVLNDARKIVKIAPYHYKIYYKTHIRKRW